ncbi:hypothetical protein NPIL_438381 [Nephila pilipes]|uniref:Uncharacterized protein n=1 Tax=Nephila pilipes TaxID=299642 RepID=A0A8X6TZK4_NEPPI|nr:hypothetical protein NPIL_438381 [Nephila pilipes]
MNPFSTAPPAGKGIKMVGEWTVWTWKSLVGQERLRWRLDEVLPKYRMCRLHNSEVIPFLAKSITVRQPTSTILHKLK